MTADRRQSERVLCTMYNERERLSRTHNKTAVQVWQTTGTCTCMLEENTLSKIHDLISQLILYKNEGNAAD